VQVIRFTEGATDPLKRDRASGARVVPLADGFDDVHLSCLHLEAGGKLSEFSGTHDCALLLVHGNVTFTAADTGLRLDLLPGVGVVVTADERYTLESPTGAIVMVLESVELSANERGLSTPSRIMGQRWPGEDLGNATRPTALC
jgi:hypothetical protein